MRVSLKGLPDKLRGAAWPSSARGVSCPVKSGKPTGRKARTLRGLATSRCMQYQVNIETCWLLGLWSADHGTLAKGVVSIVNTNQEILKNFQKVSLKNFDITGSKFRKRELRGYGLSWDIYFTRLPARRFLEQLLLAREKLSKKKKLAYLAGRFDGDGNAHAGSSTMCIFYGHNEKSDAEVDARLIQSLGFDASIEKSKKVLRLRIRKPRYLASKIVSFVKHPRKKQNLREILRKRPYGPETSETHVVSC